MATTEQSIPVGSLQDKGQCLVTNKMNGFHKASDPKDAAAKADLQEDPKTQTHRKIWYAPNQFEAYGEEEIAAVTSCLRDGWLAGFGPRTEAFEQRVADLFAKKHGVFVNSGSSANLLSLLALEIGPEDEVVTPACTFATVLAPIVQVGAKPIFVDVEVGTYVPSVEAIMNAITPKTKVLFIPNLIGSKPDWAALRKAVDAFVEAEAAANNTQKRKIWLIEDSCDTITNTPESDIAVTSFYASHVITAGGSGGMVMFNDMNLKKRATMYRDWGRIGNNSEDLSERFAHSVDGIEYDFKFLYGVKGYNFKSSEMNAAFGLAQLDKLDRFCSIRRTVFERYLELLKDVPNIVLPKEPTGKNNWLALPLMTKNRATLLRHLETNGVQTRVCFAGNITRHPAYREYLQNFEVSDRIMEEGFLLGAHHGMTIADVDRVCSLIKSFMSSL